MLKKTPTVSEYTVQRLADLGLHHAFGVPGDYTFPIDNAIEACPTLTWVLSANELNAAYAADGYARIRGAALLTTTYGVGELSALNGMMGARAHRLPIFHVVGSPSLRIQKPHLIAHHSLGDGLYGQFAAISQSATCVSTQLTAGNAVLEIDRVIREAFRLSAPAYILIPEDQALMPIIGETLPAIALAELQQFNSVPQERDGAVSAIVDALTQAKQPVALPTTLLARYGLVSLCEAFLSRTKIPFATMPMDKGILPETHPGYLGIYNGSHSSPPELARQVEAADLVLDIGGLILEEINTGFWSANLDSSQVITLGEDYVWVGGKVFTSVSLRDILSALLDASPIFTPRKPLPSVNVPDQLTGNGKDPICSATFYVRLHRMLRAKDILVAETGSCILHLPRLRLPDGVGYQTQTLWSSVGWGTPAALGMCLASPEARIVLVAGDGAQQFSANEIGVMGRYGVRPVIFVLNNGLYGIEEVVGERGHIYDDLAPWNYAAIPAAMGCKHWFTATVVTVAELEAVIEEIQSGTTPAYIEVMIPAEESQPLPKATRQQLYKVDTPLG